MTTDITTTDEARRLVQQLSSSLSYAVPYGSMSTSIYDTAWVSMVTEEIDNHRRWLFPSSFKVIVDTQSKDGGWTNNSSEFDAIITSLAALLALLKHVAEHVNTEGTVLPQDVDVRVLKARNWLGEHLRAWDVHNTDRVGFELLVPAHLRLLETYNVSFEFPGYSSLMELNRKKLAKFDPTILYQSTCSAAHSLEAFVGLLDFDRLNVQQKNGSILCSPSATAAYLIFSSSGNNTAEGYLRQAYSYGSGSGSGRFPSAFPSEIFESSWMLSTLIESGFSVDDLDPHAVDVIASHLENQLEANGGRVGFTEEVFSDVDDTAKVIHTLHLLKRAWIDPSPMIKQFYSGTHFRTYAMERTPSLSANCNVLKALLTVYEPSTISEYILGALSYICNAYFDGKNLKDKWNESPFYTRLLITQALSSVLHKHDEGLLDFLPQDLKDYRIPMILIDIMCKTLNTQDDGSWGQGDHEVTSYAVLTLTECVQFSWATTFSSDTNSALSCAKRFFLAKSEDTQTESKLWIEKVAYSSRTLRTTYCLAALRAATSASKPIPKDRPSAKDEISMTKLARLFATLPLFTQKEDHTRRLSLAAKQSLPLLSYLRTHRLDIFPQRTEKEDKYLMYIPLTWTACNAFDASMPLRLIQEMALLSMLNYQVDEYMEAVVQPVYLQRPDLVRSMIYDLCSEPSTSKAINGGTNGCSNGAIHDPMSDDEDTVNGDTPEGFDDIKTVLLKFVDYFINHPSVKMSPESIQKLLRRDLAKFLQAHITQALDNHRMTSTTSDGKSCIKNDSVEPFWTWVHGTGALHTSCPMSFTFYGCLISDLFGSSLHGPKQRYLAADLQSHLSAMCRMYNDWGSEKRDREECNLNCLDFPEFQDLPKVATSEPATTLVNGKRQRDDGDALVPDAKRQHSENAAHPFSSAPATDINVNDTQLTKQELMNIAQYERCCLETAFRELEATGLPAEHVSALRLFVDVTDLYGQLYVARDIGVVTRPSQSV